MQRQSIPTGKPAWPSRVPAVHGNRRVVCHLRLRIADSSLEERLWPAGGPHLTGWRAVIADVVVIMGCSRLLHQRLMEACSDVLLRHMCCHDCRLVLLALIFSLEFRVRHGSSSVFHLFLPWLPLPLHLSPSHTRALVKHQVVVQKPL